MIDLLIGMSVGGEGKLVVGSLIWSLVVLCV